jgi:hypothetical protein
MARARAAPGSPRPSRTTWRRSSAAPPGHSLSLSATTQTHSSRRRHDERHPPYAGRPLRRAARLPVEPNYTTIHAGGSSGATLRVHYVDEQPAQEGVPGTVLLLHGEPTWSYLYRTLSVPFLYAHAEGDYGVGDGRTMLREGIPGA